MNLKFVLFLSVLALVVIGGLSCRPAATKAENPKPLYYTCPMHPSVKLDHPGACPICGMTLEPVFAAPTNSAAISNAPGGTNQP